MFKSVTSWFSTPLELTKWIVLGLSSATLGLTEAAAQAGIVNADTSQAAPVGRYLISGKSDTLYFRGSSGPKTPLVSRPELANVVEADTASGRAVLKLPSYVAAKIPDSSHIAIEADYIKARSSGNSYFDTLRADYFHYNLLKDSIELVLPDFSGVMTAETSFTITFYGSDDDDSLFVYSVDSSKYRSGDSLTVDYFHSTLYFSDTVYFYSKSSDVVYASNFMSSTHDDWPFRLPLSGSPLYSFTLYYNPLNNKYYLK